MKKYAGLIILVLVVWTIGSYLVSKYNTMVVKKNARDLAWAQVENQLQRRFDLIPQLAESVSQVFRQEGEKNVYLELAKTREAYAGAKNVDEKIVAAQNFSSGLSRLLAITEAYPVLRASENVKELQTSIEGTENRLAVERMRFNEVTGDYNGYILIIPNNLIAKILGFEAAKTFASDEGSKTRPDIKKLFNN
jgi:LemA protein